MIKKYFLLFHLLTKDILDYSHEASQKYQELR